MKHNSLISANGFHNPLASTTIKSSFLTAIFKPLLLLFLLVMGSSVVWARPTIYGEGLPGLNASGASNWDSNTKEMSAYGEANTYYAEFLNVAATDNNKYRFKIAVNGSGDWWSGAMDSNNVNEGMGNVDIVTGNETQISFKMPFDGDVYIFYKSTNADNSKVWIVAVPQNVAAAPNNSSNRRMKTDIMLSGNGWTSEGIKFAKNDAAPTYRHVTSYILPTKKNTETGAIRFEMYYDNETYISGKDASVRAALSTSTPQRIIYLWDGDKNGSWIAYTLPAYPVRKSGWKLFIEGYNSGNATNLDANGEATVTLSGGSTYQFFIANTDQATTVSSYSSDIKSYPAVHGVNCFGGCYIDESNSSNVSFHSQQVYDASKYGTLVKSVVAAQDLRGVFQVSGSGTKDVTFTFDGGVITINAVDHADVGPKYTVTLHPNNGGSNNIVRENVPEGSNSSAAALNLAEVTYGLGTATWYTDVACTTPFTSVTGNMDLYAKWGVSGNYYIVGDLWMYDAGGNWDNNKGQLMTNTNGVCTVTYTAPEGLNRIEIIKDKDWNQKINNGSYSAVLNASSPIPLSVSDGHIVFTLAEAKRVTITFDGKVSVSATDYSFDQSVDWRVKTSNSGWGNNPNSWDHSNVMTKTASGASIIIKNVPANTNHSFMITRGSDEQAAVGTYNFNALWLDTSNPSSGLTWNMQNTNIGDRQLAQTDNEWRNCSFRLSVQSDLRITFDGGKIRCDIVAPNTITFNSNGGSAVASQEVSNGGTASEPSAPTKDGYTFVKWQLNGSDYNFSTLVTGNITLDAVWAYKAIESVSLNKSTLTLYENSATQTLTPSYLPADVIGVTYSWSVDPAGVVSVTDGVVSVVAPGTATITCTATDQESHSQTATCAVTVHAGEGCVMEETPIAQLTVDQMEQSGMFTESMNTEPEQLNKIQLKIGSDENHVAYVDPSDPNVKHGEGNSDYHYWYLIEAGTASYAANGGKLYYLKNVGNGKYLCISDVNIGGGNWGSNYTITADKTSANEAKCTWFFKSSSALRLVNLSTKKSDNTAYTTGEMFLHRYSNVSSPAATYVVTGSSDGNQGNWQLTPSFINTSSVANPDYLSTPVVYNTRSYYRFAQDAAISMTLDKKLRADDKIVVYCYNPSNAARNGGLFINNIKVSDISIPANSAIEFEYVTVAADADKDAIAVKSDDNNFCVAAVDVLRSLPVAAQDPELTWSAPATYYSTVAAGNFTFTASSAKSSGTITYSSDNETVATVENGIVTPLAIGTAHITASIEQYNCFGESNISYAVVVEQALQEAIDANSTLTLAHDYTDNAIINKAITINGQGHTIGNLTVEQTGDLTLNSGLTVNDFTICAKAGNTGDPAASGQARDANNNLTVNGNAYFLYTVDPSGHVQYGWYDFTVPFPVNAASGIKGIQEGVLKENFANGTDYAIMEYLGDKQAQGQYPYKKFSGIMQPNKLYSITLDNDYNYNTLRMQKTADGELVAGDNVTLHAYAGSGVYTNLNGVGNGTLHHADAGISGTYIQVYQSGKKTFLAVDKTQYSLVVGTAFMVQETGSMTLSQATHGALLAPSRYESAPATAIQIAREGQPFSDQLFISASETGGQAYTPGVDVAKAGNIGNVNVPQIWTTAYDYPLCVHEAQLINGEAQYNLSLYAPADGTYTLTSLNIPADYSLYLTQDGNTLCELSEPYTLDLPKGITTQYGLLLVDSRNTPTDVDNISTGTDETKKIMLNGILYIRHKGKLYNAQGASVR